MRQVTDIQEHSWDPVTMSQNISDISVCFINNPFNADHDNGRFLPDQCQILGIKLAFKQQDL